MSNYDTLEKTIQKTYTLKIQFAHLLNINFFKILRFFVVLCLIGFHYTVILYNYNNIFI
nr:MAG TPA: hypothetical protein [Caudoviricetes sp.]